MDKKKLDYYYSLLDSTVLRFQNTITGLIPSSPSSSDAWVRDNTYASLSIWGLSLAYRKLPDVDEDRSRGYELEKCVVKLMRGILMCYLKQCDKMEASKKFQDPSHSLHAKFDANTCKAVVGDRDWGHLQIDAVSVYLLTLAQMTASGLRIIWTVEEVAFIQNLIFYIEQAYRIPDYGIWERGDKTNHGLPELNTSSIGMAKAALEAMSDLDLFGADGSYLSTIHVFPDERQQCNTVIESVLPRESNSKETDAALLSILTYPGFAVADKGLVEQTRSAIIQKLLGRYGSRRFLRDGFRTAREDASRKHYEPWELRAFEGIECEWPMFFAWLALDAMFREDYDDGDMYIHKLQELVVRESQQLCEGSSAWEKPVCRRFSEVTALSSQSTVVMMPESFSVPAENIDRELAQPHSQKRISCGALPHIWGQSLYILSNIIYDGLLLPGEIDPLGRRLATDPKPDLSVQVVLVAEDDTMKQRLRELQVDVQTAAEIYDEAGIQIYPAKVLSQLYKHLGVCSKLSLSGRANKEVGVLSTSQFYRLGNQTIAFIPQFFDYHAFYLNLDVNFILDSFRTCVAFLKRAWASPGRPLLIFPVHHWFFQSDQAFSSSALITTVKKMATGYINGTRVTLGTLKTFEETSSLKKLNLMGSADKVLSDQTTSSSSSPSSSLRRRLTRIAKFESADVTGLLLDPDMISGGFSSSSYGRASPTANSGSSPSTAHEQDTFQRSSMRRKSMALAMAVNLDLINRDVTEHVGDGEIPSEEYETSTDTNVDEDDLIVTASGTHLLRRRTGNEDLAYDVSKLTLKRLIKPEAGEDGERISRSQPASNVHLLHGSHLRPGDQPSDRRIFSSSQQMSSSEASGVHSTEGRSRRTSSDQAGGGGSGGTVEAHDWITSLAPEQLVLRLTQADLAEQVELLCRLRQLKGLDWDTGIDPAQPATVRTLLKEIYEHATQSKSWFLLRYTTGLLGKVSSSLVRSLTDILVMQKQVTVGLPPEPRERVIGAPLPPDQLMHLIQDACGEDILMTVMTQEILIYLSMIGRTHPQYLANILRLRIGLIIKMMCTELARTMCLSAEDSLYALFTMSPFDTKRLLTNLLSGEEIRMVKSGRSARRKSTLPISKQSTGAGEPFRQSIATNRRISVNQRSMYSRLPSMVGDAAEIGEEVRGIAMRNLWSRRRKIDGALNRVPPRFYERVYTILSRVHSLSIGGNLLCNSLTREMTMEEHKFALAVEHVCTMVSAPEYRQLLIEATHVLGTLMMHDQEKRVHLDCTMKMEDIVEVANIFFLLDQVKYDANAVLCCAKLFKDQSIDRVEQAVAVRKPGSLICHGLHNICQHFYNTPPAGRFGTMSYMVRAVSHLIHSFAVAASIDLNSINCSVQ